MPNKQDNDEKSIDLNYETKDWEDALIDTLADKYGLDSEVVMDIAVTFALNEVSAMIMKRPCMMSTINPLDFLKLGPTTRTAMKTLKPTEIFVVQGGLRRAKDFPLVCTQGEHNGEFMITDTQGNVWYESDFLDNIKALSEEELTQVSKSVEEECLVCKVCGSREYDKEKVAYYMRKNAVFAHACDIPYTCETCRDETQEVETETKEESEALCDTTVEEMKNLKDGDKFVIQGVEHTAQGDSHLSGDSSCDEYIVYDTDGDCWFESDFARS